MPRLRRVVGLRAWATATSVSRLRRRGGLRAWATAGTLPRLQRAHCRDCCNFVCQIQGCPRQDLPFSWASSLLRHMQTMHGDNPRALTKSKDLEVHQALGDAQITFEYQHYLPCGCGLESETAHAFVDFALPTPWGYVLLEVDEEQHKVYDPSCDVRRDFDMAASVALGSGSCWCCATTRTPSRSPA